MVVKGKQRMSSTKEDNMPPGQGMMCAELPESLAFLRNKKVLELGGEGPELGQQGT